jgi:hypothetical protein
MGTDGACSLLFCGAKRSGAFPPNMPAGLRARVSRLGGFTRPFSGYFFLPAGARLFVIKGGAVTSRSRLSTILMGCWSAQCNDFTKVLNKEHSLAIQYFPSDAKKKQFSALWR